jgi:group I intron endonuclease
MSLSFCGVYEIRCVVSNHAYCGSALNVLNRWAGHKRDLRGNTHHCKALQQSWDKHGPSAFVFEVLECCSQETRRVREQFWLDADPTFVYNSARIVDSPNFTEEERARLSARMTRINQELPWTLERRAAASQRMRARPRGEVSAGTKAKQSVAAKARCARNKLLGISPWGLREAKLGPRHPDHFCACGCGKKISRRSIWSRGHGNRKEFRGRS